MNEQDIFENAVNELEKVAAEVISESEQLKYIPLNELIEKYPDGVTVNGCIAVRFKDNQPVKPGFTFEENPENYFLAVSGDLGKIFERWVEYCGGDESKVNLLLNEKPVKIKIKKVAMKSKNGFYTKVTLCKPVKKNA